MQTRRSDHESWIIFGICLAFYIGLAWVVVFQWRIFAGDAAARALQAWLVFFSAEPKLANIGFVWGPLPVLLQLPLVLIAPLRESGFSGNLVTVVMGAGACGFLSAFFRHSGLSRWPRYLLVAAFALNPMIAYYSTNGMSEITMIFFLVVSFYSYERWTQTGSWIYLSGIGTAMALAFLTRQESLVFAGFFALAFVYHELRRRHPVLPHVEATLLLYTAPLAFIVALWLFLNWVIMGDALYFARSPYSAAAFTPQYIVGNSALLPFMSDVSAMTLFVIRRLWQMFPPYLCLVLVLGLVAAFRRSLDGLMWVFLALSVIVSALLSFLEGTTLIYLRYYILAVPMSYVLVAPLASELSKFRGVAAVTVAVLLALSAVPSAQAMESEVYFGEQDFVYDLTGRALPWRWSSREEMANYIVQHTGWRAVLSDAGAETTDIIFLTERPWLFVLPSDTDFEQILRQPYGKVSCILLPSGGSEQFSRITQSHPDLMDPTKARWVKVEFETPGFVLYRVVASPFSAPLNTASEEVLPPEASGRSVPGP